MAAPQFLACSVPDIPPPGRDAGPAHPLNGLIELSRGGRAVTRPGDGALSAA